MMQVVQIQCPRCRKVLRAPAAWAAQPMRCKHCQQVFQSRLATGIQAASTGLSPALPARSGGNGNLFDDLEEASMSPAPSVRRRGGSGIAKAVVALTLLLALGGGLIALGIKVAPLLQEKDANTKLAEAKEKKQKSTVSNERPDSEDPPKKKPNEVKNLKPKEEYPFPKIDNKPDNPPDKKNPEPKREPPPKKNPKKNPEVKVVTNPDPFPRRALLINVNDYLYWNPVSYGSPMQLPFAGGSTGAMAAFMAKRPFQISPDQITELSDGVQDSFKSGLSRQIVPPWKQVIENTLLDFLKSSRTQDRIIVLFAGHAVDVDKKSYLIPLEGKSSDPDSLIPLAWVYEKLAACPARQKVLILDVCRYPPAHGMERPAPGPMGEDLDKMLQQPPAGVQVWSSCIKDQQSIELEKGSVFLQALCAAIKEGIPGIQDFGGPLPIEPLVPIVNQRLKAILDPQKLQQISRITGKEPDNGAPYNKGEPMPEQLAVQRPKIDGEEAALTADINRIREEIALLPSTKVQQARVRFFPPVSYKTIANYKADYASWDEIAKLKKDENAAKEKPLRKAVLDAIDAMNDHNIKLQERLISPGGGAFDGKVKAAFLLKQKEPAEICFYLEQSLKELENVAKDRDAETKRFQAHYDFTMARVKSRLIYVFEYDFMLGQIRADNLPALEPIHNGWRLGSSDTVAVTKKEQKVKTWVKEVKRAWKDIGKEYPGTPWAILAAREELTSLGLVWRPTRD